MTPLIFNSLIGIGTLLTSIVAYKISSSPSKSSENKIKIMSVRKNLKKFKDVDAMDNKSMF